MNLHELPPGFSETPQKRSRRIKYDPDSEIVRGCHIDKATGLSQVTIWRMRRAGTFPEPIQLGDNSVGWRRSTIRAWHAQRDKASVAEPAVVAPVTSTRTGALRKKHGRKGTR